MHRRRLCEDGSPLTNYPIGGRSSDFQRLDPMSFYREYLRPQEGDAQ